MQSVVPRFVNYPGNVWRCGPSLGEDNQIVLQERLGLSEQDISELELSGIVGERGSVT
jgi:formyl-CoA transferase